MVSFWGYFHDISVDKSPTTEFLAQKYNNQQS